MQETAWPMQGLIHNDILLTVEKVTRGFLTTSHPLFQENGERNVFQLITQQNIFDHGQNPARHAVMKRKGKAFLIRDRKPLKIAFPGGK